LLNETVWFKTIIFKAQILILFSSDDISSHLRLTSIALVQYHSTLVAGVATLADTQTSYNENNLCAQNLPHFYPTLSVQSFHHFESVTNTILLCSSLNYAAINNVILGQKFYIENSCRYIHTCRY
jgi:hypothetical protein